MKLADFRKILEHVPDDADINFADGNFGGIGDDITQYTILISADKKEVLLTPPYWEAVV